MPASGLGTTYTSLSNLRTRWYQLRVQNSRASVFIRRSAGPHLMFATYIRGVL